MVLFVAVAARRQWPNQQELSRKIVHIGSGFVLPLAWFVQIPTVVAVTVAATATLIAFINHRWRLIPAVEDVDRTSYGTVAYGLSITLLLIWFWPDQPDAVVVGVLVMALGDGLAGLIGRQIQSTNWSIAGQTKSLLGTSVMAGVSFLILVIMAACMGLSPQLWVFTLITIIAVLLEQFSMMGLDNLSVPIVTASLWAAWMS